jgi:hypothetical protein
MTRTDPNLNRAVAEIREGDELWFDVLGVPIFYTIDRVETRDDGVTLHLVHAGGGTLTIEHTVIAYATPR